jgi:hypothetical protein
MCFTLCCALCYYPAWFANSEWFEHLLYSGKNIYCMHIWEADIQKHVLIFFFKEMCFYYTILRDKILQDSKISVTYSARTSRP